MGKGLVSGLSFDSRLELCHYFKNCSYHNILEFFPLEIAEEIINEIKRFQYKDVILRGMGQLPNGGVSMNIFKYLRKDKIFVDIDRELMYIPYDELWNVFNYDGFIRGKRLCDLFNATKNKDEKFYYLLKAGMCNIGYCNSKNPFGVREDMDKYYKNMGDKYPQKNFDLQYRMYQINHMKYRTLPEDIGEQLKKRGRVKTNVKGWYSGRPCNWAQEGVSNMENKIFIPKKLTTHEHGLKVKVKEERLMKGRYLQCEEISNKYQEGWYAHDTPQLIYYDADMYPDKPILKEWFKKTYPYDPILLYPSV